MGLESSVQYLEHVMGVALRQTRSSHFVACCPFHPESDASFHVYADGHMHCYGGACNVHFHDVIGLIQAHERISYTEARVRALALHLQDITPALAPISAARSATSDQRLFMGIISEWSSRVLAGKSGRVALDYLTRIRKLDGPYLGAILTSVGYISGPLPKEVVETVTKLFGQQWITLAKETGLLTEKGYPRMRERLMFWVNDQNGEVVNYQGRILDDQYSNKRPKYLGPVFTKRPYIPSKYPRYPGTYICEGPLDAIAVAVQGYFAVALMGSKIPPLSLLKQWPQPLYGLLDHDETTFQTGQKAQAQLAKLAHEGKLFYQDVYLPIGCKDPAEALCKLGSVQFRQNFIQQAA